MTSSHTMTITIQPDRIAPRSSSNARLRPFNNQRGGAAALIPFLFLVIILLVLAAFLLRSRMQNNRSQNVVPVPDGLCTCSNIPDLEKRNKEAGEGILQYEKLIQNQQAADASAGKQTGFDNSLKDDALDQIQKNSGLNAKARSSGVTDGATCQTEIQAPNRCIWGSLQTHENTHSAKCLEYHDKLSKQGKSQVSWGDYKKSMSMTDFYKEEISGYTAELYYIDKNLQILRKNCQMQWRCIDDKKIYPSHEVCERSCRGGLGKVIRVEFRCDPVKE